MLTSLGAISMVCACDPGGRDSFPRENHPPSVRITGGVTEGRDTDYRVEMFWFGSDPDGSVAYFEYAIDDTTSWTRTDRYSERLVFSASGERPDGTADDFHTFFIRAIDDRGQASRHDSRAFNATTIAPVVRLLGPIPSGAELVAAVSNYVRISWHGTDDDATTPDRQPVGYQLKLVKIDYSSQPWSLVRNYLFHTVPSDTSTTARTNLLLPDSLVVPLGQSLPTENHYHRTDWWPKRDAPFRPSELVLRGMPRGDYALVVRAVDEADAVTPNALLQPFDGTTGNIVKLDIGTIPVNPHLFVEERNFLGTHNFTASGQSWRVEVPVNVPLDFRWTTDAQWYGAPNGDTNFALDIADPDCLVCSSSDGIGGWIGWGNHNRFQVTFDADDAGEVHTLFIKARDGSGSATREILVAIHMEVIAFSFDRTAAWVDDFIISGLDDCAHDAIIRPWIEDAVAPHLTAGESLHVIQGHRNAGCAEVPSPEKLTLSELGRYRLLLWNVAASGSGSALGLVTDPEDDAGKLLSTFVRAGGSVIVWGRYPVGALLGDYYPSAPYVPEPLPGSNYGPGSFLYDQLRIRTTIDRVGRGGIAVLQPRCSGIVGLEATATARDEGFPVGIADPTGYDPSRVALWHNNWAGVQGIAGGIADGLTGNPPLHVAGLDTLYTFIPNSWSYERVPDGAGGTYSDVRTACGSQFGSPFRSEPVVLRYRDRVNPSGRLVLITTPLYHFQSHSSAEVAEMLRRLTSWALGSG
jgi:hypothetical protein